MMPARPMTSKVLKCACGDHCWAPLTKGFVALVSPEDAAVLASRKWHATSHNGMAYVAARIEKRITYLHRVLIGVKGSQVDHAKHNGLDNRRSEIRVCDKSYNARNTRSRRGAVSEFKGVYKGHSRTNPWQAQITSYGFTKSLGSFRTEEAAARAYDAAAIKLHGEFAFLNFGGDAHA